MIARLGVAAMLLTTSLVLPARAADVGGAWLITISKPDRTITGKGSLKQDGDTVTGWVGPSETDPIPVDGTVKGNKLTLKTHPQPGRAVAFDTCVLTIEEEKMAGSIDTDKGTIEFVRAKP